MKNKQKWSGLKLTKEELEQVRKEERLELVAEIVGFLFVVGFISLALIIGMLIMGGCE